MITFSRKMELSITVVDSNSTEQDIVNGLTDGTFCISEIDQEIYNISTGKAVATINELNVADIDTPDADFNIDI